MKASWIAVIAIVAGVNARAAECNVEVYIQETVPVPLMVSIRARVMAAEMFREIGVPIRWHAGEAKPAIADRSCGPPLGVEIQNTPSGHQPKPGVLAYASPFMDSGTCIHVFMDRVHKQNEALTTALLAHVLAHEIGHVLEGIARHSDDGVMKAHWAGPEFHGMIAQTLTFAPEDVEFIRRGIAGRMALTAQR